MSDFTLLSTERILAKFHLRSRFLDAGLYRAVVESTCRNCRRDRGSVEIFRAIKHGSLEIFVEPALVTARDVLLVRGGDDGALASGFKRSH